jgi:signal transduction histidine kinase
MPDADARPLNVLLVEDSPVAARLTRDLLQKGAPDGECKVEVADRLAGTLERLKKPGVDVVLLDLGLPDSSGLETAVKVCTAAPDVPVVVFTALTDEKIGVESVHAGAQDYLVKGHVDARLLRRSVLYSIERKRAQKALRETEERLRRAQKLEVVGRLAGGVAHDFNNLLSVISGYGEMLLNNLSSEDPRRDKVTLILQAASQAADLTRQLLTFSRGEVLQPRILDPNHTITEMNRMLRRIIGEDVELRTLLDPGLGRIKADVGQVQQIILNLAVNARDAMPNGGKLTIETQNVDLDGAYAQRHAGVKPGRYVMVAVSDTGIGMDKQTQAHIFEPFFTTKDAGKGTGLGLATVYGIVKERQGDVWVYSELRRGTTFKIYLPRVEEAGEQAAGGPVAQTAAPMGSETILVVEDNAMLRGVARETLGSAGYEVLEAADAKEALDVFARHKRPIHLLVTDIVMPGMNGRELADRLVKKQPQLAVLFMSGYTNDTMVQQRVLQGDVPFLSKPFTPMGLLKKTFEVLQAASLRAAGGPPRAAAAPARRPAPRVKAQAPRRRAGRRR